MGRDQELHLRDSAWEEARPSLRLLPTIPLQEVGPYMLRREKKEVFQSQDDAATAAAASGVGSATSSPQGSDGGAAQAAAAGGASKPAAMPHKNDLIVWLKLKPMQKKVYQAFLNSGGWVGGGPKDRGCTCRARPPMRGARQWPVHNQAASMGTELDGQHGSRGKRPVLHLACCYMIQLATLLNNCCRLGEEGVQPDSLRPGGHHGAEEGDTGFLRNVRRLARCCGLSFSNWAEHALAACGLSDLPADQPAAEHWWISLSQLSSISYRSHPHSLQVCDHPALLSERAAHGIVSGVNRARRQAAARQAGGSSDVEIIEDSSEGEELEDSEEGEWESGERASGGGGLEGWQQGGGTIVAHKRRS